MPQMKFVLIIGGCILSMGALLWLGLSAPGGFVYYMTVSEFLDQGSIETEGFRVNGKVAEGTIERHPSGESVVFLMFDEGSTMQVSYTGIIPDTFVDNADVVVEGRLERDNVFYASNMLAKCPSKYESADGYEGEGYDAPSTDPAPPASTGAADVSMLSR